MLQEMSKTRSTVKPSPVQVCISNCLEVVQYVLTNEPGSGCIAALEAEKFLAEHDTGVEKGIEDQEVKKSQTDSDAPEYKQNPLL